MIRFFYLDKIFADNGYLLTSRTPFYSLVSTLPLLLLYEIMTLFVGNFETFSVRNYAEIVFKELLNTLGLHSAFAYTIAGIAVLSLIYYFRDRKRIQFKPKFFIYMILESLFYAVLLGFIATISTRFIFMAITNSDHQHVSIMLSLGAGFYEELIFRVLLYGITTKTLVLLKVDPYRSNMIAAIFSSILFSWSHYIGFESFNFISAFFRFFMGVMFCILYKFRGFGITAYTHAFYDLLLVISV